MKIMKSILCLALVAACGKSSSSPVSGNIHGTSFTVQGARTSTVDSNIVITLVNVASSCSAPESPSDGQVSIDVTVPKTMLAPGTYPLGKDVTVGVTKMAKPAGSPISFDAVTLASGTLVVQSASGTIQGTLSGTANGVSLDGSFTAPICP